MDDKYQFRHESERRHALESMRAYLAVKPEQITFFEQITEPYLGAQPGARVLDACCGVGDLTYYLSRRFPDVQFVGIDRAGFLVEEARRQCADRAGVSFEEADLFRLSSHFAPKSFDYAVCKQTLSWLPDYQDAVRELMTVTRRAVFFSSLFYDGWIDVNVRVREWQKASAGDLYTSYYNVYSVPALREFCVGQGATRVSAVDFDIQIDLPRPPSPDRLGTYTRRLDTGERLQFSGPLFLPWKIVCIELT